MKYRITAPAAQDLSEIIAYIARDSRDGANRIAARLADAFERVGRNPGIGNFRADLTHRPVRFWTVYPYLIVYRPDSDPCEILRVLHGARDIASIISRDQ